jgi:hypothetical protein
VAECDDELSRELDTLLSYLKKNQIKSCSDWVPQIDLVYSESIQVSVFENGLSEDPIALLEGFGESEVNTTDLRAVIVIAESMHDDIMVSCTDSAQSTALAYVICSNESWIPKQKYDWAMLKDVDLSRVASLAVWRGIARAE